MKARAFGTTGMLLMICLLSGCVGSPAKVQKLRNDSGSYEIWRAHSPEEAKSVAAHRCPYGYDTNIEPYRYKGRYSFDVICRQPDGTVNEQARDWVYKRNVEFEAYFKAHGHFDWDALFHVVGAVGTQTAQGMAAQNGYLPPAPRDSADDRLKQLLAQHEYEDRVRQQQESQAQAQTTPASDTGTSRPSGTPANGCVMQSGLQLRNICAQTVSVVWCTNGAGFNCDRGRNMEDNIPPNGSVTAAPLADPGSMAVVNFYACVGANTAVAHGWQAKCEASL